MRVVQQSLLAYVKIVRNVTQESSKITAERKYNDDVCKTQRYAFQLNSVPNTAKAFTAAHRLG
jgi:hypothetical protein